MAAQDDKSSGNIEGSEWATITAHDTNPIPFKPIAIHNGSSSAGTIVAIDAAGNTSTFYLVAGQTQVMRPVIITTASTVTVITGYKR
jgi:hypothetical protein